MLISHFAALFSRRSFYALFHHQPLQVRTDGDRGSSKAQTKDPVTPSPASVSTVILGAEPRLFWPVRFQSEPVVPSSTIPNWLQKGPKQHRGQRREARHLSIGLFWLVQFQICNDQNGQIDRTPCPQQRQLESSCRDYIFPCCHRCVVVHARYTRVRNTQISGKGINIDTHRYVWRGPSFFVIAFGAFLLYLECGCDRSS
jgi:hypothetical protein